MTDSPQADPESDVGEQMSLGRRALRGLARRFPRTRRAYNWMLAKIRHQIGRLWRGFLKLGTTARWFWHLGKTLVQQRRDPRLTVSVDIASFWEPLTGIGWYLYRLLECLAQRQDLSLRLFPPTIIDSPDLDPPTVGLPAGPALTAIRYRLPTEEVLFAGTMIRILRRLEPLLIAAHGSRVLFAPNYFLPRRFSLARGVLVATVHDLGSRQLPWTLSEDTLNELESRLDRTLTRAGRLITVSAAVRNELIDTGYPRPERIHVIHHGPGHLASVTPGAVPAGTPERFALHVGTLEPRKNVGMLLAGWRLLRQQIDNPPDLLLCGKYGWKTDLLEQEIGKAEREGWLRHLGYVSEEALAALYRQAQVVVFPSLYEGFGLPAVEAQWAGTPLVCSDLPVLREVAGNGAIFVPVDRPDRLAEAVANVLEKQELRSELVRLGRQRVKQLSWESAAQATVSVWTSAMEDRAGRHSRRGKA